MLQLVIVGGGIQGTYLANHAINVMGLDRRRIVIIDPNEELCAAWKHNTTNCGMKFLRSPLGHHIDVNAKSLQEFLECNKRYYWAKTFGTSLRPSLPMFNKHVEHIVERERLDSMLETASVYAINRTQTALEVQTDHGCLLTKNIVIAIGSNLPLVPTWARKFKSASTVYQWQFKWPFLSQYLEFQVEHVFANKFQSKQVNCDKSIAVVGGGITAAQLATSLAQRSRQPVKLICRRPIPTMELDFDPCWAGNDGTCVQQMSACMKPSDILALRNKGSMPGDVARALEQAVSTGKVELVFGDVQKACDYSNHIELHLANGHSVAANQVILATGATPGAPGGKWLQKTANNLHLPTIEGHPAIDNYLRWHEHIFVCGALGLTKLGPAAANIIGARMAASRIALALR